MTGEELKRKRLERGLTQQQLGLAIGVTQQSVNRWENNRGVKMYRGTEELLNRFFSGDIIEPVNRDINIGLILDKEEKRSICLAIDDRIDNLFNNASNCDRQEAAKEIASLANLKDKISKEI